MCARLSIALAVLSAVGGTARAQIDTLDLIPSKAAAAIAIRDADDLRTKADALLKDTGLNVPLRPTDALAFVKTFLGIKDGLDLKKPAAAALLRPDNATMPVGMDDLNNSLYIALAFTDLDKMAGNFGFTKGELKRETIAKIKIANSNFAQFVFAKGTHLFLAATAAPLERLRGVPSLKTELSAEQRGTFADKDVLVHINPKALGVETTELAKALAEELGKTADPQEKESGAQLVKTLQSLRFALGGMRVDQGLGLTLLTAFPTDKDAPARAFLAGLRGSGNADLNGLPQGNVLAAQAYAGNSAKNAILARTVVNFLLRDVLEAKQITSPTDRPAFAGVFNEVWQRLRGSRTAVYMAPPEKKLGMFSALAILDTDDPTKFLTDLRTLAKIADGTLDLTQKTPTPALDFGQAIKDLSAPKYQAQCLGHAAPAARR